jgi:hypothetical protein
VAELSAAFALKGYQPQTISVRSEAGVLSAPRFVPNPVHADLQPVGSADKKRIKQTPVAAAPKNSPALASDAVPASSNVAEAAAPAPIAPFPAIAEVK